MTASDADVHSMSVREMQRAERRAAQTPDISQAAIVNGLYAGEPADNMERWQRLSPEEQARGRREQAASNAAATRRPPRRQPDRATDAARPSWRSHVMSAADLRTRTYPPVRYVVPGILPEGLAMLAGRPKVGKSWLALDIAASVASEDGKCLGLDGAIAHGSVLYAACEDSDRRLQRRLTTLLGATRQEWPARLTLATQWARLDKGGVRDIAEWIATAQDPQLIILDTLASVRPQRDRDSYATDYAALGDLHRLLNDRAIAGLVLHHTRKSEGGEDWVDAISGTLGLAGCVDTPMVLQGGSSGMTLCVRGRDVEEAEHAIAFNRETARWTIRGAAADVHRSDTRRQILDVLQPIYPRTMGPSDIAAATGIKEATVKVQLGRMLAGGDLMKHSRGEYSAPTAMSL